MKKVILRSCLLIVCMFMIALPMKVFAAEKTPQGLALSQAPVQVFQTPGGCSSITEVVIQSVAGNGYQDCFFLYDSRNTWGYMGLGDPGAPGDAYQSLTLITGQVYHGWIRYYGGNYPGGRYCIFGTGQIIQFYPTVDITQIALNQDRRAPTCP